MLIKIAWRNVWRNRRRSAVLMLTVALGTFAILGTQAFVHAFERQMIAGSLDYQTSPIEITPPDFHREPGIDRYIPDPTQVIAEVAEVDAIQWAARICLQGMGSSPENSAAVEIFGVDPDREILISAINQQIVEGSFLDHESTGVLIGSGLAQRLDLRLGEKMVVMVSGLSQEINSAAYRVAGIFHTGFSELDKRRIYLHQRDAAKLAEYGRGISMIAVTTENPQATQKPLTELQMRLADSGLDVKDWRELNPFLVLSMESFDYNVWIFGGIMFTAIAFSIINIFLMVIFERIREIGITLAMGAPPRLIRFMIMTETLFIALFGAVIGQLITWSVIGPMTKAGLDLSVVSEGLGRFGISSVIYPFNTNQDHLIAVAMTVAVSLVAALYPAIKASRFKVVDAIHFQ